MPHACIGFQCFHTGANIGQFQHSVYNVFRGWEKVIKALEPLLDLEPHIIKLALFGGLYAFFAFDGFQFPDGRSQVFVTGDTHALQAFDFFHVLGIEPAYIGIVLSDVGI